MNHLSVRRAALVVGIVAAVAKVSAAPVWESRPVLNVREVEKVDGAGWVGFSDGVWKDAAVVERLSSKGVPEADASRTQVKMALSGGVLWVYARCHQAQKPTAGDCVEMLLACRADQDFPTVHVRIGPDGKVEATREPLPAALSGPLVAERVADGLIKAEAGAADEGWWMCVGLPLEKLGIARDGLRMNVMRVHAGAKEYPAWGDLWGGRLRNVTRLGRIVAAGEEAPRIALPAELAIGHNALRLTGWRNGYSLKMNGRAVVVDEKAVAAVEVPSFGPVSLSMQNDRGEEVRGYRCEVARPVPGEVNPPMPPDADKYRDGIEKLQGGALVRAAVCDAANVWRMKQKADGAFGNLRGETLWPQAMTYVMAVVYKTKWAENPYAGDKRFLESAMRGMECALDPARHQTWLNNPDNRSLQAFLMTYELLKGDVPAQTEARWRGALQECAEAVVRAWVRPISYRLSRYSDDIGTSTNHWSLHAANVYTAGRIFGRKEWLDLGTQEMRALARHEQNGIFPERRNVPTPSYNWLTTNALAEYFLQSGDQEVAASMKRCAEFAWKMSVSGGEQLNLFDGRVNGHTSAIGFPMMYGFTPEGRSMVRECLENMRKGRGPGRFSPEGWHRWCELALAWPEEGERPPADGEFSFMDGLAVAVRRNGFYYGLSGICADPIEGLFRLDPQNAVELHHHRAGKILLGDNSQRQPEAGTFFRKVGDKTAWLPKKAEITRLHDGHVVRLTFDNFQASVAVHVISETEAQLRVEVLDADGADPVVFNCFPGGAAKLLENGRGVQTDGAKIVSNVPLKLETGMKLYHPYVDKFTMPVKPNRAWVEMKKGDVVVLQVIVDDASLKP